MDNNQIRAIKYLAETLLLRLEKISADSPWAHQASGVRASIAKILAREDLSSTNAAVENLKTYLELGFEILEKAAGEIPDDR